MKFTECEMFGKTAEVPLVVYLNGKKTNSETWDETYWICRGEEWYGLSCSSFKNKLVRVIEESEWRRAINKI
jgi:hypothetical protein